MGETDEYPDWAVPVLVRRMFWKDYGIRIGDQEFSDFMDAMKLQSLENQRESWKSKKNK